MEEIKNWWGVFGLFGCVTVVSGSLKRRCHRQGSLATLTKLAISTQWCTRRGILLAHIKVCKTGATVHVCVLCFKFQAPQKSLPCSLLFVHLESMICCFWPHRAHIDTHFFLMLKWIAFHVCGCPWIPASSIWYLQYLLNQWELHWKPLSYHHHWSFPPEDLSGFKLDTFSFQHVLWLFQSYSASHSMRKSL